MDKREKVESYLSFFAALIAISAILINLSVKGLITENIIDAVKEIFALIVTIIVLLLALRISRKMGHKNFLSKFEELLGDWAKQNIYLIDSEKAKKARGKEGKRSYFMLLDHSNVFNAEKPASEFSDGQKGAFLYLPSTLQLKEIQNNPDSEFSIYFQLNNTTFKRQTKFKNLNEISNVLAKRINDQFSNELNVEASVKGSEKILINLSNMEKTEKNAELLINMVDYVKTMILALA